MDELIKAGLQQGFGYGLFVCLFVYVLRTTGERENKYQTLLDKLTDKFKIMEDIKEDVKDIKSRMERK